MGNASVQAGSLEVTAGMTASGADSQNDYDAEATSGAGGGKNSIAGSLALNLVLSSTEATVAGGANLQLGSGNASLSASSASNSVTKALPGKSGGASGAAFGLGLSLAV